MEQSEAIDKIAPAFVAAQAAMEGAKKASNNPHFKSRYADLAQVWGAAEDALRANDLAIIQGLGEAREGAMHMDTMLLHSSGQWLKSHASIPMQKVDPQGYGSATTYLRRYSLAAMLGIVQEDDDGNAASRPQQRPDVEPRQNNVTPLPEQTGRKQPERLKGPIKTRAELRTACGNFVREIHACGDIEQLECLLSDQKALIKQVQEEHEFYWLGDGADFSGLQKEINNARASLEQEADEHTERWRNDARAAG